MNDYTFHGNVLAFSVKGWVVIMQMQNTRRLISNQERVAETPVYVSRDFVSVWMTISDSLMQSALQLYNINDIYFLSMGFVPVDSKTKRQICHVVFAEKSLPAFIKYL